MVSDHNALTEILCNVLQVGALVAIGDGSLDEGYFAAAIAAGTPWPPGYGARPVASSKTVLDDGTAPAGTAAAVDPPAAPGLAQSQAAAATRLPYTVAPGRGLWLETCGIRLPEALWTDADWCNNATPGYATDWGVGVAVATPAAPPAVPAHAATDAEAATEAY
jgi:hypothetical protein